MDLGEVLLRVSKQRLGDDSSQVMQGHIGEALLPLLFLCVDPMSSSLTDIFSPQSRCSPDCLRNSVAISSHNISLNVPLQPLQSLKSEYRRCLQSRTLPS